MGTIEIADFTYDRISLQFPEINSEGKFTCKIQLDYALDTELNKIPRMSATRNIPDNFYEWGKKVSSRLQIDLEQGIKDKELSVLKAYAKQWEEIGIPGMFERPYNRERLWIAGEAKFTYTSEVYERRRKSGGYGYEIKMSNIEWRGGMLIGSLARDIDFKRRTITPKELTPVAI